LCVEFHGNVDVLEVAAPAHGRGLHVYVLLHVIVGLWHNKEGCARGAVDGVDLVDWARPAFAEASARQAGD
jgi:hypothetical protein